MTTLRHILLSTLILLGSIGYVLAQETTPAEEPPPQGWETGAGLGFDFAQLLQINPKQGAGQNRLGFGGAANFFGIFRKDRLNWDNQAGWQFGLQRLGSGVVVLDGEEAKIPFQKAIDELRLGSKIGYQTSETSKWFYAANATLLSQVTPTYTGTAGYPGNFIRDVFDTDTIENPLAKFFAPATITISAGLDFKPIPQLSLYYSPVGGKFIIVADDEIAALGVHGNPVDRNAAGVITSFKNVDAQLGSLLRLDFNNKFIQEKMAFTSTLLLYSNYLRNPQNVDVDWTNQIAYELIKNLQLSLLLNVFYDDDVLVQISDREEPNGISGLGKRVSLTQQFLVKYSVVF